VNYRDFEIARKKLITKQRHIALIRKLMGLWLIPRKKEILDNKVQKST